VADDEGNSRDVWGTTAMGEIVGGKKQYDQSTTIDGGRVVETEIPVGTNNNGKIDKEQSTKDGGRNFRGDSAGLLRGKMGTVELHH